VWGPWIVWAKAAVAMRFVWPTISELANHPKGMDVQWAAGEACPFVVFGRLHGKR